MDGLGSKQLFDKAVSYSSKEFIRGFLIGQFALLLLLVFLARLLLFRTPTPPNTILRFPQRTRKQKSTQNIASSTKDREKCAWLNAALSQLLMEPLRDRITRPELLIALSAFVNEATQTNEFLDRIEFTCVDLSSSDPELEWVELEHDSHSEVCSWFLKFKWDAMATIDVETAIVLRLLSPQPFAALPCQFSFSINQLAFILGVTSNGKAKSKTLSLSVLPDEFLLDLQIHSMVGHRTKLKDVPKITAVLQDRIHQALASTILAPKKVSVDISPIHHQIDALFAQFMAKSHCHND